MQNVPGDWSSFFARCRVCRARYHASEGGCCEEPEPTEEVEVETDEEASEAEEIAE